MTGFNSWYGMDFSLHIVSVANPVSTGTSFPGDITVGM
jgi:hypothetical protein